MLLPDAPADPLSAPASGSSGARQRGAVRLRVGDRVMAEAELDVTPALFLAIGAMVGAILIGSAVVVHAARR